MKFRFELPKLNYAYDALEPYIDAKTMEIHHLKHTQTYVDNANKALEKVPQLPEYMNEEEMLVRLIEVPGAVGGTIKNNGGGAYNHKLFFEQLKKNENGRPAGELAKQIDLDFGSFDKFKELFKATALGRFGSGWAWLILNKGTERLEIMSTPNQDSPIIHGAPLLGLDVWEHAYYLNYQNKRADYVEAFFNIIDWDVVAKRLKHNYWTGYEK
jgi:superoxide dismutase, Fe-Mn family